MTTYHAPRPAQGIRWRRLADYHGHNIAATLACDLFERAMRKEGQR